MRWLIRRVLKQGKGAVSYEEDVHFGEVLSIGRAADHAIFLSVIRAALNHARVTALGPGRYKVHPIFDWTDRNVYDYLKRHVLPYHPLWERGYISIGDWHTTRSLREAGDTSEATRFFGLQRECGLHLIGAGS